MNRSENASMSPEVMLVRAAAGIEWKTLPDEVCHSIRRLFIDWLGSALAGTGSAPVESYGSALSRFGLVSRSAYVPGDAPSPVTPGEATVVTDFSRTVPLCAAMLNGAVGHVVEMDDIHNGSITHPGACIFPAALATAEAVGAYPHGFLSAAVAGYEVMLRVGEALGPEHYAVFHTTGTAGTIGAAVATGRLLGLDEERMLWALGNAGSQAAGLWQFLADGAMTKQLHTAKAAFNGMLAACLAAEGFTGPTDILLGDAGMLSAMTAAGVGVSGRAAPTQKGWRDALLQGLQAVDDKSGAVVVRDYKTLEVSFKCHASCRHTHPSVDALLKVVNEHGLEAGDLERIRAFVYSGAWERLKDVEMANPWSAKFNLPFCLSQAALRGCLGLDAFTASALDDPHVLDLMERVDVEVDPRLDQYYPRHWASRVEVDTADGRTLVSEVMNSQGDPENPMSDEQVMEKFHLLSSLSGRHDSALDDLTERLENLEQLETMRGLFADLIVDPEGESGGAVESEGMES